MFKFKKRKPKVFDYSNTYWGHDYNILEINDDGSIVDAIGWGYNIKKNDIIFLKQAKNKNGKASYRVKKIELTIEDN